MEGKYILLLIILSLCVLIAVIKIILKQIERKEVNSILEFMGQKTKEDKEIKQKFNECIKIIEDNKNKE